MNQHNIRRLRPGSLAHTARRLSVAAVFLFAVPLVACSPRFQLPQQGTPAYATSSAEEPAQSAPPSATFTELPRVRPSDTPRPPLATTQASPTAQAEPTSLPSPTSAAETPGPERAATKFGPTLTMMLAMRNEGTPSGELAEIVSADAVEVYIQFTDFLDDSSIETLEALGITFHRQEGAVVHVGTIYSADVLWESLHGLAEREEVQTIESAWKPGLTPPGAGVSAVARARAPCPRTGDDQRKEGAM